MKIDAAGIKLIADHEGLRLTAYQDSGGVWTIGYGHTGTAKKGMKITKETALKLLAKDIARFEQCVDEVITVQLTQTQFNALVSFAFNRGCNGFKKTEFVQMVNAGRYDEAAKKWLSTAVTAGGKKLAGLEKRRKSEVAMFQVESKEVNLAFNNWILGGGIKALFGRAT